ncbi:MAG: response regulator [Deltaproteobacteria bacterium]|nr:response regulator [Deltaproteobacteria bacterium]MBW2660754.1 response regulator [Deltaproteobacteria bacterium]
MLKTHYKKLQHPGMRGKLILVFLLVGLVPVVIVSAISISYFSKILTNSIGNKFQHIAVQMSNKLDVMLRLEIEMAKRLGTARIDIREEIQKANMRYPGKIDAEIEPELKQMDSFWIETSENDVLIKSYLENSLANKLKIHQASAPKKYAEIIATDIHGALIAGTGKTSDYYQKDEEWWIKAFNGGRGATYVDDICFDKSANIYSLNISIPVMDKSNHHAIGVIKMVLNAKEIFKGILDLEIGKTGHAHLIDSNGKILIEGEKSNTVCVFNAGKIPSNSAAKMLKPHPSWYIGLSEHYGEKVISASAPLAITSEIGSDSFGKKNWYIMLHESKSEALSALYRIITILILVTTAAAAIIIFVSIKLANRITNPIHLLHDGAEIIGNGNLDHRLSIKTGDEIEQLANEFNRMSDKLQNSYQTLGKKVQDRTAELQQTKRLLEMILNKTNTGVDIIDSRHNIRYVNDSWEKIYGDPTGRKCYEYFKGKNSPCQDCGVTQSLKTGLTTVAEGYNPKDKKYRQVITVPYKDKNDETVFAEVNVDITKRKQTEDALLAAKAEVDQIFHSAADGMRVIDKNFNIIRANETLAAMVGISRKDIIGKKCYDIFKAARCHTPDCSLRRIMSGEERIEYESMRIRPDGRKIPCIVASMPFKAADGTLTGIIEDFRDITKRQNLSAQIQQAQKMESIGTMAGGIAHDFNNLLGGMLGYASIIKMNLNPTDAIYKYVEFIEKAGERAATLTNQLLAFSRKGKYEIAPVNINDSIRNVLNILESTTNKNIEISCSMADNIPCIGGDPTQIEQTIMNICVNAVDAMPNGGKLQIETKLICLDKAFSAAHPGAKPGNYIHITVSDTGHGMDKETLSKIFEPFFTTKDKDKGTGLGMSMVYGIVKNHGGYINVYSEPGKGTIFNIYFPQLTKKLVEEKLKIPDESTEKGQETILVVDDEEIIRTMLQEVLESLGYNILLADNGESALNLYREHSDDIDLVIIDMIMPIMGGEKTYSELKKIDPDIKAILSSGFSEDAVVQEILRAGVNGFIHKPFTIAELSKKVRKVLSP